MKKKGGIRRTDSGEGPLSRVSFVWSNCWCTEGVFGESPDGAAVANTAHRSIEGAFRGVMKFPRRRLGQSQMVQRSSYQSSAQRATASSCAVHICALLC